MRSGWRSLTVLVVAVAAIILTPAVAMACRITNATPWNDPTVTRGGEKVYVWFSCGSGCGSYYEIEPGKYVNTAHGKGGQVQACTFDGEEYDNPQDPSAGVDTYFRETGDGTRVDGSGEARLKMPGDNIEKFHWDIYDSNNNVERSVDHGSRDWKQDPASTFCWDGSA